MNKINLHFVSIFLLQLQSSVIFNLLAGYSDISRLKVGAIQDQVKIRPLLP